MMSQNVEILQSKICALLTTLNQTEQYHLWWTVRCDGDCEQKEHNPRALWQLLRFPSYETYVDCMVLVGFISKGKDDDKTYYFNEDYFMHACGDYKFHTIWLNEVGGSKHCCLGIGQRYQSLDDRQKRKLHQNLAIDRFWSNDLVKDMVLTPKAKDDDDTSISTFVSDSTASEEEDAEVSDVTSLVEEEEQGEVILAHGSGFLKLNGVLRNSFQCLAWNR